MDSSNKHISDVGNECSSKEADNRDGKEFNANKMDLDDSSKKVAGTARNILSPGHSLRNTLNAVTANVRNKVSEISSRLPEVVVNAPLAASLSATSTKEDSRIPKKQKIENSGNGGYLSMFIVKASSSISKNAPESATLDDDPILSHATSPDKRPCETAMENPASSEENSDVVGGPPSIPMNIDLVPERPDAAPAISQNGVRIGDRSNAAPAISQNGVRNGDRSNAAQPRLYYQSNVAKRAFSYDK